MLRPLKHINGVMAKLAHLHSLYRTVKKVEYLLSKTEYKQKGLIEKNKNRPKRAFHRQRGIALLG